MPVSPCKGMRFEGRTLFAAQHLHDRDLPTSAAAHSCELLQKQRQAEILGTESRVTVLKENLLQFCPADARGPAESPVCDAGSC